MAELILAGPQYRRSGTIRLRITPGGFATSREPEIRVEGGHLVTEDERIAIAGRTCRELAQRAGVDVGAPEGLYAEGSGVSADETLTLDPTAAAHVAACFAIGDAALRRLGGTEAPVLWPEHFDLSVSIDEINYGVSPGDAYLDEPYAYVGPWQPRRGQFWNAPFGAARAMRELAGVDTLVAFFSEGRALARH